MTKIKHLATRSTSDQQAQLLADFYGSLFHMNDGKRTSDGYVWVSLGAHGPGRQAGPDHFGFEVDDIHEVMDRSKAAYPNVDFLQRPSTRPFAEIGSHDPAGNVFDLYQTKPDRVGSPSPELPDRYISHFQLRAVNPAQLADFYQKVYGFELENRSADEQKFALTDGRVTFVIAPWNIKDYGSTGVVRPAIDHLGFKVESLEAFVKDVDELRENRPDLFPTSKKDESEGKRQLEILAASCSRGAIQLHDPDGWLLDVSE